MRLWQKGSKAKGWGAGGISGLGRRAPAVESQGKGVRDGLKVTSGTAILVTDVRSQEERCLGKGRW